MSSVDEVLEPIGHVLDGAHWTHPEVLEWERDQVSDGARFVKDTSTGLTYTRYGKGPTATGSVGHARPMLSVHGDGPTRPMVVCSEDYPEQEDVSWCGALMLGPEPVERDHRQEWKP